MDNKRKDWSRTVIWTLLTSAIYGYQLSLQRTLFIDEANLIRAVIETDMAGLFGSLPYAQYAPPLYLLLLKGLTSILGTYEWVFRLPSLCAAIGSTYYMCRIWQRLESSMWSDLVIFLFIINPLCLRYGTECKQYMMEFFVATLLIYQSISEQKRTNFLVFLLAPWLAFSSIFVIAAIGLSQMILARTWRVPQWPKYILAAASFLTLYLCILRSQVGSDYLEAVHAAYFPAWSGEGAFRQNVRLLTNWLAMPGNHTVVSILIVLMAIITGITSLWNTDSARLHKQLALSSILIGSVTWVVCSAHLYLWRPRTLLFSMVSFYALYLLASLTAEYRLWSKLIYILCSAVLMIMLLDRSSPWTRLDVTDYSIALTQIDEHPDQNIIADESAYPTLYYYCEIHPVQRPCRLKHASSDMLSHIRGPALVVRGANWPAGREAFDGSLHRVAQVDTLSYSNVAVYLARFR